MNSTILRRLRRCAAADLRQSVEKVQDYACELNETLSAEQWQQLVATSQEAVHCATSQPKLNSLEQSDCEETIECWLNSNSSTRARRRLLRPGDDSPRRTFDGVHLSYGRMASVRIGCKDRGAACLGCLTHFKRALTLEYS